MMGLSFSNEFFYGNGEQDYYAMPPSDTPTSVLQALVSMDDETRRAVAKDILNIEEDAIEYAIHAESFESDLIDKIKEVDLCDDLTSPVTVYLDNEQNYSVTVYDAADDEEESE